MQDVQTIRILAARLPEAMAAIEKLANKARRYGCPDITVTVGERTTEKRWSKDWDGEERSYTVEVVELLVAGDAPRIGKHEFLARVELHDGGNLVDTRPGVEDLDARFRHTDGFCDHCQSRRDRKDVFVVRDTETGAQLQIGRNCLRDFLGMDNPASIAHRFAFFSALGGFEEEFCGRGKEEYRQSVEGVLSLSAVCIRLFGWCSKGQAQHDPNLLPTSYYVSLVLNPGFRPTKDDLALISRITNERTEADYEAARQTLNWVRNEMKADSDYCHNLKVILGSDNINDARRLGLAVSAVSAYHRATEQAIRRTKERQEAAKSEHLGAVGQRLRGLLLTLQSQRVVGGNDWGDLVLVKFADAAGNVVTWFTSKGTGLQPGEQCQLDGTVKAHSEYNGAAETQLTRCKLTPVNP